MSGGVPALSVQQPWASLLVSGVKDVENRTWRTKYRGWLFVHASARPDRYAADVADEHHLTGAPLGVVLGAVRLVDCVRYHESDWALPDQWNWVVDGAKALPEPVPCKGALGLWALPDDVAAQIGAAGGHHRAGSAR